MTSILIIIKMVLNSLILTTHVLTQIIEKVFLVKSLQKEIKQVVLLLEETITKRVCSISSTSIVEFEAS